MAVYTGATLPIFTACALGLYGMITLGERQMVNSIKVIPLGEHAGKL